MAYYLGKFAVKRDLVLLLLGVVLLAGMLFAMWWAWWSSPRITTPGCLSAKNSVVVVYSDSQGLLAEHIILQLSVKWAGVLPSNTRYCIAYKDDIGIRGLPFYPYIVVRGSDVAKKLAMMLINTSLGEGYFPLRADLCARLAYETYSYGGENMPAPRFERKAELIVVNPLQSLIPVREAQLFSELPELSVQAATKISTARIVSSVAGYELPEQSVFPMPILHSRHNLAWLTPTIIHLDKDYYVFKRMGWALYDLGIVQAVSVEKQSVPERAFLKVSLDEKTSHFY